MLHHMYTIQAVQKLHKDLIQMVNFAETLDLAHIAALCVLQHHDIVINIHKLTTTQVLITLGPDTRSVHNKKNKMVATIRVS